MVKLRTNIPTFVIPEIPGVYCKNEKCVAGIGLGGSLDELGKSFDAKCPTCGQTGNYRKSQIQSLQVERSP